MVLAQDEAEGLVGAGDSDSKAAHSSGRRAPMAFRRRPQLFTTRPSPQRCQSVSMTWRLAASLRTGGREGGGSGNVFQDLAWAVISTIACQLCRSALFMWEQLPKDVCARLLGAILGTQTGPEPAGGGLGVL